VRLGIEAPKATPVTRPEANKRKAGQGFFLDL
jgi:sRNA-binding carbon storage regulator CsrA